MGAGRPPLFSSALELQEKIDEYFDKSEGQLIEADNEDEEDIKVRGYNITITGLALYLGFESRQSIYDYEERGEYSYIIKRARLQVENAYESNLYSKNPTGSIFALKNMGWRDRTEVESHNTNTNFNIEPTTEEAARIKEALDKSI
jgi:hypothetical protein